MATTESALLVTNVSGCARCGQNHEGLTFRPFARARNPHYSHWALCPTTGEPILLVVRDTEGKGK